MGVLALLRGIVFMIMVFMVGIAALVLGLIVEPFADVAMSSEAAQSVGFTAGLDLALWIGLVLILPLLIIVGIIWLHIAPLQQDVHHQRIR